MSKATDDLTWVVITRGYTPTDAHLMKNCFEAAGIPSVISDANLVQADSWLTNAVGGVRVKVPLAFEQQAKEILADYEAGRLSLDPDEGPRTAPQQHTIRLWNPDSAAFFSLFFTPLFGAVLHFINSRAIPDQTVKVKALVFLLLGLVATGGAPAITFRAEVTVKNAFAASGMASAYTVLWYLLAGFGQSKWVSTRYGARYQKKTLLVPLLLAALGMCVPGAISKVLAELHR